MNRKGDWIQVFLIMFFFLLIIIGLALLFREKDLLQTERPELTMDMTWHNMNSLFTQTLRLPVDNVDVNGDGIMDDVNIAEAFVLDDRENDASIEKAVQTAMPPGFSYSLSSGGFLTERVLTSRGLSDSYVQKMELPNGILVTFMYDDETTRELRRSQPRTRPMGGP